MVKTIAQERKKRATAGTRMSSLVGQAAQDDDAFWSHSTWGEDKGEISEDGSFHESDEESDAKMDTFDSDFDDSEGEEEVVDGEEELLQEERRAKRAAGKNSMIEIANAGRELMQKKKNASQRKKAVRGGDMNAGLILNVPGAAPIVQNRGAVNVAPAPIPTPAIAPVITKPVDPASLEPRKSSRARSPKFSVSEVVGKRSFRTSTINNSIAASNITTSTRQQPQQSAKSKHKRKFTQEEVLLEAVSCTESENLRWILNRKRLQMEENSKAELNKKMGHHGGNKKIISKFNSRRGCLNTFTFPEMDHVPEVFTRSKTCDEQRIQMVQKIQKDNTCMITGKKARYRDPKTNLGYYDLAAFKELRRIVDAGGTFEPKELTLKEEKSCPNPPTQISEGNVVPSQQSSSLTLSKVPPCVGVEIVDKDGIHQVTDSVLNTSIELAPSHQPSSIAIGQDKNGNKQAPQQKDKPKPKDKAKPKDKPKTENGLDSVRTQPSVQKGTIAKHSTKSKAEPKTVVSSAIVTKTVKPKAVIAEDANASEKAVTQNTSIPLPTVTKVPVVSHKNDLEEKKSSKEVLATKEKTTTAGRKRSLSKSSDGTTESKRKVDQTTRTKGADTVNEITCAELNSNPPIQADSNLSVEAKQQQPRIALKNEDVASSGGQQTCASMEAMGSIGSSSQTPNVNVVKNSGRPSNPSFQSQNDDLMMINMQLNALNQMHGMGMPYSSYNPMNRDVGLVNNATEMMAMNNNNNTNGIFQYSPANNMAQFQQMLAPPSMDVTSMLAMSLGQQGGMPMQLTSQQQRQQQMQHHQVMLQNRELQLMNQLYAANQGYPSNRQQPPGDDKNQKGQWPNGS